MDATLGSYSFFHNFMLLFCVKLWDKSFCGKSKTNIRTLKQNVLLGVMSSPMGVTHIRIKFQAHG